MIHILHYDKKKFPLWILLTKFVAQDTFIKEQNMITGVGLVLTLDLLHHD